ncbi:MAG: NAD(P)-binding protein, partial [Proteobacteria bacterium]|nr:NAD(P)-binding protein [Pseudomonadota bacterium]
MPKLKIAVIGAGPCGLSVCKTLNEFGLDYDCLEASNRLGGLWNVDDGGGGYASLSSNTSNPNMAYADFP